MYAVQASIQSNLRHRPLARCLRRFLGIGLYESTTTTSSSVDGYLRDVKELDADLSVIESSCTNFDEHFSRFQWRNRPSFDNDIVVRGFVVYRRLPHSKDLGRLGHLCRQCRFVCQFLLLHMLLVSWLSHGRIAGEQR